MGKSRGREPEWQWYPRPLSTLKFELILPGAKGKTNCIDRIEDAAQTVVGGWKMGLANCVLESEERR